MGSDEIRNDFYGALGEKAPREIIMVELLGRNLIIPYGRPWARSIQIAGNRHL